MRHSFRSQRDYLRFRFLVYLDLRRRPLFPFQSRLETLFDKLFAHYPHGARCGRMLSLSSVSP
jgi:hypothetical protein